MALPFFYKADLDATLTEFVLDEETSKHVAQVLRMQNNEQLQLTDGKGNLITASIVDKQHFRTERMSSILVSAMLQSQQTWLPVLRPPVKFTEYLKHLGTAPVLKKFIAHCEAGEPRVELVSYHPFADAIILTGPEGDFTINEIELALQHNFMPVALGSSRLRTETAGVVAATILLLA